MRLFRPPLHDASHILKARKRLKSYTTIFALIFVVILWMLQSTDIYLFSKFETCLYIILVTSPLGFFLYHRCKAWMIENFDHKTKFDGMFIFSIVYSFFAALCILSLNLYMDTSHAEKKTFTVIEKHYEQHKNSKTFYADIVRPDFVKLPYFFSDTEHIAISSTEYDLIDLNTTQIEIMYHPGGLGFPWYEGYSLTHLTDLTPILTIQKLDDKNKDF